jgi:hypothetical protein
MSTLSWRSTISDREVSSSVGGAVSCETSPRDLSIALVNFMSGFLYECTTDPVPGDLSRALVNFMLGFMYECTTDPVPGDLSRALITGVVRQKIRWKV